MKSLKSSIALTAFALVSSVSIFAQAPSDAKQFSKDGLSFSYLNGWALEDLSDANMQQFNLSRADSEAQMRLFVYRARVTSPEQLAEARKALIDPFVASTFRQFQQMGAKPERTPATTDFGTSKSEGVRISASLDGEPGAAEIHWVLVGQRLVVLTMFGPDKALTKAAPAWDRIRNSIAVVDLKPEPKPSPK